MASSLPESPRLSSDSANLGTSSSPPPMLDDQWSDAHDTLETDDERDIVEEVSHSQDDITIRAAAKITASATDKPHDINTPSPTEPSPAVAQEPPSEQLDAGSVHSLPVVQVTEPTSPNLPMSSRSSSSTFPQSTATTLAPTPTSSQERRLRNRTTLDARASNRISGFFSSLIHRRDHPPTSARETMPAAPSPPPQKSSSRASSPLPSRASTPPPSLPPPSLLDLGLALSSLTSHLSPSHFSSPPSSGAFLAPRYLLLCHAQGLDVLPLESPPAPQPYALIRRVPFKSVVVMEHRGVLVAIAGRRDGVRVYALEEVKRAVEWRIDVEVRRDRERARREEAKRAVAANAEAREKRGSSEKEGKARLSHNGPPGVGKGSTRQSSNSARSVPSPGIPRHPTIKKPKTPTHPPIPAYPPPAYTPACRARERENLAPTNSPSNRTRATSVNDVLAGTINRRVHDPDHDTQDDRGDDSKADWPSSDDEAINPVAAPSGSQALDERTSSMAAGSSGSATAQQSPDSSRLELPVPTLPRAQTPASMNTRRSRPANLDLSLSRSNTTSHIARGPPSPAPTLLTLRQALMASPGSVNPVPTRSTLEPNGQHADAGQGADADGDDDDDADPSFPSTPTRERISLAEALFESRLPDIPPVGTRQAQEAILLTSVVSGEDDVPASPRTSDSHSTHTRRSADQSVRRRRRWSVLDGIFTPSGAGFSQSSIPSVPEASLPEQVNTPTQASPNPDIRENGFTQLTRSYSSRGLPYPSTHISHAMVRPSTAPGEAAPASIASIVQHPTAPPPTTSSNRSRFLPRIITNAFNPRRSEDLPVSPRTADADSRRGLTNPVAPQAPAPKLEYVKLPGTKGSVMIKAVETAKKSFLAILCGDNGEKVELFAGTYRTALGLSRTFILPDSPRSLELQLQGDDLIEVFLVFSQNVFGLEPATVRVREVRIGRAERRAARRRARETRTDQQTTDAADTEPTGPVEEDTAVNVTIGVAFTPATEQDGDASALPSPALVSATTHPADTATQPTDSSSSHNADELITLAAAQMSSYTTFQQLTFAPNFPLATIADEYIIPPTYPSFLDYRNEHEPEINGSPNVDLAQVQFSPPGLPVPAPAPPSKWYYRDPKGVVHGPWKASLMQAWYKDGLLPTDLPVRREEDSEYILLRELRLQSVDPTHPFRSSPPPPPVTQPLPPVQDVSKPLLPPISLLAQPRHFGPPALFYSSRGGHSTTIVDARGRSILKGRFLWSSDDADEDSGIPSPRLGDVKRLEAFDVKDRAVLVAMRQGGLEVVDFGDALLRPADHSRTLFPHFHPPSSSVNRRGPFVWKIGTPISSSSSSSSTVTSLPSKFPAHRLQGKKQSTGPTKSPGRPDFPVGGDPDSDLFREEVLFLGRKDNEIYLCERRTGSFRILRLSPHDDDDDNA